MLVAGRVGTAPGPPRRPTLIFDGDCGFCRRWVRRLRRLDRADALEYLPLQVPSAVEVSACSRERLRQAVHFVRADGAVHAGASAVREAFRYLQGGRIVRSVLGVPGMMPLAERIYAWVARRWGPVPRDASPPGPTRHDRVHASTPTSGADR